MAIDATLPTSRRGYLSQDELEQFANINVTDATEADDKISQAEELIDAYVGPQPKFMQEEILGRVAAATASTLTLQSNQQNVYEPDYFFLCEIEIVNGTGAGQRKKISDSTLAGVLTLDSNWTTTPDTTSLYRVYQLGKFPRIQDAQFFSESTPNTYYKSIPEAVKRAVAAQVAYIIEMGEGFFVGDEADKVSESIGDYSYTKGSGAQGSAGGFAKLIAPQTKLLLRGFINRTGQIVV